MRTLLICLCLALVSPWAQAERLKDIASIAGIRSNQLIGYGLVVGLDGSGDQTTQTPFTVQTFNNMLTEFGITVPPGTRIQMKNRSEEHTSELQSRPHLVCRLLLEKKKIL